MSKNPINLTVRFLLEIAALLAMGAWGWSQHDGLARLLLGIGLPVLMAAAWGIFRVNGDPKDAPVLVPGWMRLLLEAVYFGVATLALYGMGNTSLALVFGLIVIVHYAVSYDRIVWLLRQKRPTRVKAG